MAARVVVCGVLRGRRQTLQFVWIDLDRMFFFPLIVNIAADPHLLGGRGKVALRCFILCKYCCASTQRGS